MRWIIFAIIFFSGLSCLAPVLYASDCSRWVAEYKQGILQRRAARRLRAAKYRLTALVHQPEPVHKHPMRHKMGPLEALRRFQIDCGDLEEPTPLLKAQLPPLPVEPKPLMVEFPDTPPPDLPAPALTEVAEVPPLTDIPLTPIVNVSAPGPVPEPGTLVLVLTGALAGAEVLRRRAGESREA